MNDFWAKLATERRAGWSSLRAAGPVLELDQADSLTLTGVTGMRAFSLSRRCDVLAALRDPQGFSSRRCPGAGTLPVAWPFNALGTVPMVPAGHDPPEHTRYREILAPLFGTREVAQLVPVLEGLASSLIEPVAGHGECDAIAAIAQPCAAAAVLAQCGLPADDAYRVARWVDITLTGGGIAVPDAPRQATVELASYLAEAVIERRANRDLPGLLSQLIAAGLADEEIIGLGMLMCLNTIDVWSSITFALLALASGHPPTSPRPPGQGNQQGPRRSRENTRPTDEQRRQRYAALSWKGRASTQLGSEPPAG
jgi:cytochrome P450